MDVFATYDPEASSLDDPQRFWEEVEDILRGTDEAAGDGEGVRAGAPQHRAMLDNPSSPSDSSSLLARLTSFFALCDACYDAHLEQAYNADYLLTRLVDSPFVAQAASQTACSAALVRLATTAKSLPSLYLIYDTLLKYGARHADAFRAESAAKQLIPRLVHHFWAARYAEEYIEREQRAAAASTSAPKDGGGEDAADTTLTSSSPSSTMPNDWNIKHIRSTSQGYAKRELAEGRDRALQCKLRDRAVRLLYEICRSQKLEAGDLRAIDATFINHLFELVELSRNWDDDTYNYQVIKLIVALNEQFMVSGIAATAAKPGAKKSAASASNTVMTVLRTRLNASKTFGENVIFMLNRASSLDAEDLCMQLLLLKLLYLLFTTKETSHYFYTNDLKVLVDIFIRELSDLPDDHESLRHTYLRVMHPLLTNTQLLTYPYKRPQIQRLLIGLTSHAQVRDISHTTQRLVSRCLSAQWCVDLDQNSALPTRTGDSGDMHHFSVQSIGGGPSTMVQAHVVTDSEGVNIPVDAQHEPYQGAPSSASTTAELVVATSDNSTGVGTQHGQSNLSSAPIDQPASACTDLHRRASRTNRARSVSGTPPSPSRELRDQAVNPHNITVHPYETHSRHAEPSRGQLGHTPLHPSVLSVRRDHGQRAASSSATPLRMRSSIDVSRIGNGDGSDEDSPRWETGSASGSWHQHMAREDMKPAQRRATSEYQGARRASSGQVDLSNVGSPISLTYREGGSTLRSETDFSDGKTHGRDISTETIRGADDQPLQQAPVVGKAAARRRPPAPPSLAGGSLRSRKERNGGMFTSPSDPALAIRNGARGDAVTNGTTSAGTPTIGKTYLYAPGTDGASAGQPFSMPVSPGDSSADASRTSSPAPALGMLSPPAVSVTTGGSAGPARDASSNIESLTTSSVGRRRRPPPPPVDRSTKGPRTVSGGFYPADDSSAISSAQGSRRGSSTTMPRMAQGQLGGGSQDDAAAALAATEPGMHDHLDAVQQHASDYEREQHRQAHYLANYMDKLHVSSTSPYGWS